MKKESVLKCCKILELGDCSQWGRVFSKTVLVDNLLKDIYSMGSEENVSSYTKA